MERFKIFTGGIFETNCYLMPTPKGNILFDAPQDADAHFADSPIDLLVLTHGHFDHVIDAAKIQQRHNCRVLAHADTVPMVSDPDFFRRHGFGLEVEPVHPDWLVTETPAAELCGENFQIFEVPGHCPGSLCFYHPASGNLIGGDVLFAGGVGRWDLPGGDFELLKAGIQKKLYHLPDPTRVWPGHGPTTTIGYEKKNNPWVTE